jgi:dienelactone hydrolase
MNAVSETGLDYAAGGQHYRGLLLKPSHGQARAAVVLLPDWRGQSPLAREHAGHLVGLGAVVAIADLYGDGFSPDSPDQVGPMVKRLIEHRGEGVAALAACVELCGGKFLTVRRCSASATAPAAWWRWIMAAAAPISPASSCVRRC